MSPDFKLCLYEELMLLSLRDQEGTIASGAMYQFAIAGAIISDLIMGGRIGVKTNGKKKRVEALARTQTGDQLLDECLEMIFSARRPASVATWVSKFTRIKDLKHRVAMRLCDRGILRADEGKLLLIFTRKVYPELDPRPEQALIDRLRSAIFSETADVEPRTAVLISLANSTGVLKTTFGKKELKPVNARIEQIVNGEVVGMATRQAIEAMQTAVAVAATIPAIVASTVHS